MLAVNLGGPWNTCRTVGRAMMARGRGSVINIASTNSIDPSPGIAHYCVSKAGLAMLTKCLALEWASTGVRVNAVGPGPINTPMTIPILEADPAVRARWESRVPLGRIGEPRRPRGDVRLPGQRRFILGHRPGILRGGRLATRLVAGGVPR